MTRLTVTSQYDDLHILRETTQQEWEDYYATGYDNDKFPVTETLCGEKQERYYYGTGWRDANAGDFGKLTCIKCHNIYYGGEAE